MKDLVCQVAVAEVGESTTPRAPPIRQAFFWTKNVEGLTIVTSTFFLSMPKKKKIKKKRLADGDGDGVGG